MGLRPQHFRLQALPANSISRFTSVVLRKNSKRRAQPCPGKQQLPKQKPYPLPFSVQKNEEEQSKCWNKHLLGKFDEMILNKSLTEEKSCRSNGSLRSYSPGRHKPCLLKRLDIIVTRHYSVTIPSNPAPIRREPKLNWCGTTTESHVAASSYKVWVSRCLKAGPPASYYHLQPGALALKALSPFQTGSICLLCCPVIYSC